VRKDFTLLKEKALVRIFKENANFSKEILILELIIFFLQYFAKFYNRVSKIAKVKNS
jgi:hypothetical protein